MSFVFSMRERKLPSVWLDVKTPSECPRVEILLTEYYGKPPAREPGNLMTSVYGRSELANVNITLRQIGARLHPFRSAELAASGVPGTCFRVNLILHTLAVTTLAALVPGARVNLEVDLVARYVARLSEA